MGGCFLSEGSDEEEGSAPEVEIREITAVESIPETARKLRREREFEFFIG